MPNPLSPEQIEVIEASLAMGVRQSIIASAVGCCRRSVSRVASDMKPPPAPASTDEGPLLTDITGHCPHCGRKMLEPTAGWPCLACRVSVHRP